VGVVGALALHALVGAAALIGFQRTLDLSDQTHAVPVDLITIADKTNVRAMAPPAPPPEKVQIPTPDMPPPPEPKMEQAEPAPDVKPPKFQIKEDKDEPQPLKLSALLNKLAAPAAPPKNAKAGPRAIEGTGLANAMTADIVDALRSQIARCWSLATAGAPNAGQLVVDYDLSLNPDGSVAALRLLPSSVAAASSSPYVRAAAEAASRAVYQCQPYRLPADRYSQWRQINPLRFDPRQMLEQ
jgi:hypothetical protein